MNVQSIGNSAVDRICLGICIAIGFAIANWLFAHIPLHVG